MWRRIFHIRRLSICKHVDSPTVIIPRAQKTSSPMRYLFSSRGLPGIIRCAAAAQQLYRCCELHSVQSLYHARRKTNSPMGYLFSSRGLPGIIRCAAAAQQRRCCELHSVQLLYPNYISFSMKNLQHQLRLILYNHPADSGYRPNRYTCVWCTAWHPVSLSWHVHPHTVGNSDCRSSPGVYKILLPAALLPQICSGAFRLQPITIDVVIPADINEFFQILSYRYCPNSQGKYLLNNSSAVFWNSLRQVVTACEYTSGLSEVILSSIAFSCGTVLCDNFEKWWSTRSLYTANTSAAAFAECCSLYFRSA